MSKKQKTFRPKPRVPKGMLDEAGDAVIGQMDMIETIRGVYESYGFDPLSTGALEYADALGKFLPDQDRPNEGVFSFQDDDEQWLSLRYDLTAPLARYVAEHYDGLAKPFRRYQWGPVWRNEKPGPGRYRQFTQIDADTVGTPTMAADAELIAMMAECMEALGLPRGSYTVRVNNRKVLDGLLDRAGLDLTSADYELKKLTVLRAVDKLDRLGPDGVRLLLGTGRKDDSGAFTPGAELAPDQIDLVMSFVQIQSSTRAAVQDSLAGLVGQTEAGAEGLAELAEIDELLTVMAMDEDRVQFDPSIVRGLGYYTGPVFEVDLNAEIEDEKGQVIRFGSVGSGGRYDDLIERFKGTKVPATGCSFGVSRLYAALQLLGSREAKPRFGPVIVLVLDKDRVPDYQRMVGELRNAGVRAELYLGGSGMRAQVKYADKRNAPVVVIEGEDEKAKGEVTLKDLVLGAKLSAEIEDNKEWRESQPAQLSIAREDLVAGVKDLLARNAD